MPKRGRGKRAVQTQNLSSSDNDNLRQEDKDKKYDVVEKPESKKRKTMTKNFRMKIEHWYVHRLNDKTGQL